MTKVAFPKKGVTGIQGAKDDIIYRSNILFFRGMDLRENTDRMSAFSKDTGFRDMIVLFINIFEVGTLGAISDEPKVFKVPSVRFDHIEAIDEDDRIGRSHSADQRTIGTAGQPEEYPCSDAW